MTNTATTTTLKSWGELPEDIRILLSSDTTIEKIEAIGATQGLSYMHQGFLVRICANLMKGIVEPKAFVNLLETELDIPRVTAAVIAQEINREIFSGVKESLKKLHAPSNVLPSAPLPSTILTPPASTESPKSIFEEKLAGAFQMSKPDAPTQSVPTVPPRFVMPTTIQSTPTVTPAPSASQQKSAVDPYHELPV